jgi:hypothetical protein
MAYTTDPAEAERIAACALARACLASRRLGGMADAGLLVELLLEAEARDKRQVIGGRGVISDRRQVTREMGDLRCEIFDLRLAGGRLAPEAYSLRSEACFCVAETLNSMPRFARDLLILHYIEGLSRSQLGEIHRAEVGRVRIALAEARLDFIERLTEHEGAVCSAHPTELRANDAKPDVRAVLMGLAGALNQESVRIVGETVRQYVADMEW